VLEHQILTTSSETHDIEVFTFVYFHSKPNIDLVFLKTKVVNAAIFFSGGKKLLFFSFIRA